MTTEPAEALDPDLAVLLERLAGAPEFDFDAVAPEQVRALFDAGLAAMGGDAGPPEPVGTVEDHSVEGPGGPVPVRVYRPEAPEADPRPAPVAFFHGGGWAIGSIDTHDASCRQLCRRSGAVVMSVGYRLAPEHPYPAALDDCVAATRWLAGAAVGLGADPARLVVAGDSAGGNLAASVCLAAAGGALPRPAAQVLIYPATDLTLRQASIDANGSGYLLTRHAMGWFTRSYLGGHDPTDPLVSPLFAPELAGLPPALVVTAGFDPLVDEGRAYARRLADAGVAVRELHFPALIHGFMALGGASAAAQAAVDAVWQAFVALIQA